jgi:hypothetical protein
MGSDARSTLLALGGVAMVAAGVFSDLADAVAIALIVTGAGLFLVAVLLPLIGEFEIGPGGFSAKLSERTAALEREEDSLGQLAGLLAGDPDRGRELLTRALADALVASDPPAAEVRRRLIALAPETPSKTGGDGRAAAVVSLLGTLPPADRGAVLLHLLDGLTPEQVADLLRRPAPSVSSEIERGLRALSALARSETG